MAVWGEEEDEGDENKEKMREEMGNDVAWPWRE
jgi:hypothetical protein